MAGPSSERAIAEAERAAAALEAALATSDHGAALAAVMPPRRAIDAARQHGAAHHRGALAALIARSAALIDRAPRPSAAALRAASAGSWELWDREVAAWRETMGDGASSMIDEAVAACESAHVAQRGGPPRLQLESDLRSPDEPEQPPVSAGEHAR